MGQSLHIILSSPSIEEAVVKIISLIRGQIVDADRSGFDTETEHLRAQRFASGCGIVWLEDDAAVDFTFFKIVHRLVDFR